MIEGMNYFMTIVTVPMGYGDKVLKAANEEGILDVTVLRARGADSVTAEGFFSMKIEPEEEIVLITADKKATEIVCKGIHDEFERSGKAGGSIYILPTEYVESAV